MKERCGAGRVFLAAALILGFTATQSLAQSRTWNGGGVGGADNSGNWSTAANWGGDAPDTSVETAILPSVGSGTRVVTVDTSTTVGQVRLTQSTGGAVNKLLLGAPLLVFSNKAVAVPLSFTPSAGTDGVQLDLNGQALTLSNNQSIAVALDGSVTMGSGAQFNIVYGSGGASDSRGFVISNSGTLYQNASVMNLIWAASSGNNDGSGLGRNYRNTGTWIQTNHSAFLFFGVQEPPGYGTLNACTNLGTMKVLDGSTNTAGRLYNLGTLELGQNAFLGTSNNAITFANANLMTVSGTNAMMGCSLAGINQACIFSNSGSIVVGDGLNPAELILRSGSVALSNVSPGSIMVNPGTKLIMRNISAVTRLFNTGSITQDNSGIEFDWAAGTSGGSYNANFLNYGTWVLKNASTFLATSSTNPPRPVGWGLNNSTNSGALMVLNGSLLDVRALYNNGTITLGDRTVLCGFMAGTAKTINNLQGGRITVTGTNAVIGWTNLTTSANGMSLFNGSATDSAAALTVGDGVSPASVDLQSDGFTLLINSAGNTVTVARAASLGLLCVKTNAGDCSTTLTNQGVFIQSGTLNFRPNQWGYTRLDNLGTYQVGTGSPATNTIGFRIGLGSASSQLPMLRNSGTLTGCGLMIYTNMDNIANRYTMALDSTGTIAPGAPVGTLELSNIAVTNNTGSTLAVQLYDASTFDKLKLSGVGSKFTIQSGSTLNVSLYDRYRWDVDTTFRIVEGATVSGTFGTLLWNGAPKTDEYTITYGANYIDITVQAAAGTIVIVR